MDPFEEAAAEAAAEEEAEVTGQADASPAEEAKPDPGPMARATAKLTAEVQGLRRIPTKNGREVVESPPDRLARKSFADGIAHALDVISREFAR